jgi:hypothetical protein
MFAIATISSVGKWTDRVVAVFVWRTKAQLCEISTSRHFNESASPILAPVKNIKMQIAANGGEAADEKAVTHVHETGRRSVFSTGHRFTAIFRHSSCSAAKLMMAWVGTMTDRFHVVFLAAG